MSGSTFGKRIKYNILYWFIRAMLALANALPRRIWLAFCGWLGSIAYRLMPKYRDLAIFHLGLAFGREKSTHEILNLSKQVFHMMGKNAGDVFRSSRIKDLADLHKILTVHGYEHYEAAASEGKGVIFLTCHLGAFDIQATFMALQDLKPNIIGTSLKDERLNELLFSHRNAHGGVAIERGKDTLRLVKALLKGGTVAILIDQDTKVKSRFVEFFGMQAATPVGAAILAMKTRAAVVPTYIYLGDDGMQHMHILPEIPLVLTGDEEQDMVINTQNYSRSIEWAVRQHPEQWVWIHKRWKTRPGQEMR
jgi:KDO2-lipid IV(A) lauroyltransferase